MSGRGRTRGDSPADPPRSEHEVDAAELIDSGKYRPGEWEVYNEDAGDWEAFQGGESSGAGRGGVEHVTGFVDTPSGGFHLPAMPDPEDFEDGEDDEDYLDAEQSYERFGDLRVRPRSGGEGDLTMDQIRAPLREELLRRAVAAEEQRRMDEGGNLPRLTNQEVAQALAPLGSFEGLGADVEPGVKESTAQHLADSPSLGSSGDFEFFNPETGAWDVLRESFEVEDMETEELVIEMNGQATTYAAETGEGIRIRRRGGTR